MVTSKVTKVRVVNKETKDQVIGDQDREVEEEVGAVNAVVGAIVEAANNNTTEPSAPPLPEAEVRKQFPLK